MTDPSEMFAREDETFGWRDGLTDEQYHADFSAVSSTGIRLARESHRHFYRRIVLGKEVEVTDAMRLGTAIHLMLLEPKRFKELFVELPDFGDLRSPKNREAKAQFVSALPAGALPLKEAEMTKLLNMVDSVLSHRLAASLLRNGRTERPGLFRDPVTGLRGKLKPDFITNDGDVLLDLKSCRDVAKFPFFGAVAKLRYDMQVEWYARGSKAINGKEPKFLGFIAVQNVEPFDCAVYTLPPPVRDIAANDLNLGLKNIVSGIQTNLWPGVQKEGLAEDCWLPEYMFTQRREELDEEDYGHLG